MADGSSRFNRQLVCRVFFLMKEVVGQWVRLKCDKLIALWSNRSYSGERTCWVQL